MHCQPAGSSLVGTFKERLYGNTAGTPWSFCSWFVHNLAAMRCTALEAIRCAARYGTSSCMMFRALNQAPAEACEREESTITSTILILSTVFIRGHGGMDAQRATASIRPGDPFV
jgi:hypothetical protein